MNRDELNEPALLAAIDVIGRANAVDFELGYLEQSADAPYQAHRWWAAARWLGRRLTVENHPSPAEAAEALARRILNGGTCTHCGKTIVLTATRPKGSRRKKLCAWRRDGARWVRGCAHRIPEGRRLPYAMPGAMAQGELPDRGQR